MKKRGTPIWDSWHIVIAMILVPVVVGAAVWLLTLGKDVPVLNPSGAIGAHEKELILFTLMLSAIIVIPVFIMLGVFAWRYREGNHKAQYTPDVEGNRWIEALWWGIPILIITVLSVVTWVTTHELDPGKPLVSDVQPLKVQVVALQWQWLFIYPEQHVATVNKLVIPAGTPVNFEITADGPMSAFWIPSLGTQIYAMTGMSSKLSLIADHAGTFRGTNSNISGEGYSDMNFNTVALNSRAEFDNWAQGVGAEKKHHHLAWHEYEELAKRTHDAKVATYHLHDNGLYTKVINKFAHGGATNEHAHEAREEEGHSH